MRVLLVEDDDDLREVIASGLRDGGFAVDCAADWPEADVLLHVTAYDCVVLDRMVPSGDTLVPLEVRRRAGLVGARAVSHRPGLAARAVAGAGERRGRLSGQTVRDAGAGAAGPGPEAGGRRPGCRPS